MEINTITVKIVDKAYKLHTWRVLMNGCLELDLRDKGLDVPLPGRCAIKK